MLFCNMLNRFYFAFILKCGSLSPLIWKIYKWWLKRKKQTKLFLQMLACKPPSTHLSATLPFRKRYPECSQKTIRFLNTLLFSSLFAQVMYYRDPVGLHNEVWWLCRGWHRQKWILSWSKTEGRAEWVFGYKRDDPVQGLTVIPGALHWPSLHQQLMRKLASHTPAGSQISASQAAIKTNEHKNKKKWL